MRRFSAGWAIRWKGPADRERRQEPRAPRAKLVRFFSILTVISLAATLLSGCGSQRPPDSAKDTLTHELQILRSSHNGLYFSPHLLEEPAGVQDISAALRTLELVGKAPELRLAEDYQRTLRRDAIEPSPVLGRALLVPIYLAGAHDLLAPADATVVRALREPAGWFRPAAGAGVNEDDEAIATEAALTVLDAVGQLTPADRAASTGWLLQTAAHASTLSAAAASRRALVLLDKTAELPPLRMPAPELSELGTIPPQQRISRLKDAFDYAQAASAGGGEIGLDRTAAERLLHDNAATADYPTLFRLSFVAFAASRSAEAIDPAIQRLERAALPDGSFRNLEGDIGSAIVSLYVMRLLAAAGEPVVDRELAKALSAYAELGEVRPRPAERLLALAAETRASGAKPPAELVSLCASPSVVPAMVSQDNVTGWRELATTCHDAGVPTALPVVKKWEISDADQVTAVAALVLGFVDSGHSDHIPSWVTAASLRQALDRHAKSLPILASADLARAYRGVSGQAWARVSEIRARATKLLGCSDLPTLYRTAASDDGCDLRASWAIRMLG
jgi:hypothetical protein